MLIYRVEDALGYGYKGNRHTDFPSLYNVVHRMGIPYTKTAFLKSHTQPLPWKDGIPKIFLKKNGWKFAFSDIHDMIRWFSPYDLYVMGLCGGELVTYEIDTNNIWYGTNQCVFSEKHSTYVSRETLSNYTFVTSLFDCIDDGCTDIEVYDKTIIYLKENLEEIKKIDLHKKNDIVC